jgi:hypothetical protein
MIASRNAAKPVAFVRKLRPHQLDILNRRLGHDHTIGYDWWRNRQGRHAGQRRAESVGKTCGEAYPLLWPRVSLDVHHKGCVGHTSSLSLSK